MSLSESSSQPPPISPRRTSLFITDTRSTKQTVNSGRPISKSTTSACYKSKGNKSTNAQQDKKKTKKELVQDRVKENTMSYSLSQAELREKAKMRRERKAKLASSEVWARTVEDVKMQILEERMAEMKLKDTTNGGKNLMQRIREQESKKSPSNKQQQQDKKDDTVKDSDIDAVVKGINGLKISGEKKEKKGTSFWKRKEKGDGSSKEDLKMKEEFGGAKKGEGMTKNMSRSRNKGDQRETDRYTEFDISVIVLWV